MGKIQIFRSGRHTANSGQSLAFSETDLAATARAYDPAKHEAPLVVGHPAANAPAYGWVKSLEYSDGVLTAEPHQVDSEFQEMVNAGRFKKVSASFYLPDSPQNPVPGVYCLRHVGFLGAQPPAVKGLRDACFSAAEEGVVEFSGPLGASVPDGGNRTPDRTVKLNLGRVPFDRAVEYLREKADIGTKSYTDLLHEAHDTAFVVAGLTKGEVLSDIHRLVNKAMRDGTPFDRFQKEFAATIDGRWLPRDKRTLGTGTAPATGEANTGWRARIIYETNVRTAYAAGRHEQLQRIKKLKPYWQYRHGDSLKPRPEHMAWDGLILRADDPWWQTHYPPNGWGCRCYVHALDDVDLREMGREGPDEAPPSPTRTVKYGDRMIEVPHGIDPGWAHVPGGPARPAPGQLLPDVNGPNAGGGRAEATRRQLERMPPDIRRKVEDYLARNPSSWEKGMDEILGEQEAEEKAKAEADKAPDTGKGTEAPQPEAPAPQTGQTPLGTGTAPATSMAWQTSPDAARKAHEDAKKAADRVNRAERITNLEEEAKKLEKKAEELEAKAAEAEKKHLEANPTQWWYTPPEVKEAWKKANTARAKADGVALKAFGETAIQEVLDATGKLFTNPLKVKKMDTANACYDQDDKSITLSTVMAAKWMGTERLLCSDGGGKYVDPVTLKEVFIPPRERMMITLAHELAHDTPVRRHPASFQKLMYSYLDKLFPNYTKLLYVWNPVQTEYEMWKERPNQISMATWKKMKEEKEEQKKKAQEEKGDE